MHRPRNAWWIQADGAETRKTLEGQRQFNIDLHKAQQRLRTARNNAPNLTKRVLGGFVKTFEYDCDDEAIGNVHNGTMIIAYDDGIEQPHEITVVILEDWANASEIGDAIVAHTEKLSSFGGDLLVQAYFSTFCHNAQRHIVAYVPVVPASIQGIRSEPFFAHDELELSECWRERMSSFIELLHIAAQCNIRHGGLSELANYVTCRDGLKIINMGRYSHIVGRERDMQQLMDFVTTLFPGSLTHPEWRTLVDLLLSKTMWDPLRVDYYYGPNWLEVVLRHPILLGTAEEKLECFVAIHMDVTRLDNAGKARFSNWIHYRYPAFKWYFLHDFDDELERDHDIRSRVVPWNQLYYNLFTFIRPGSNKRLKANRDFAAFKHGSQFRKNLFFEEPNDGSWSANYGTRYCYLSIIRLVKNLINHGGDYDHELHDKNNMLIEIRTRFQHFMSVCYTVINMTDDWIHDWTTDPYP
ncbi:hypothetical protein CFC21_031916 [Triticum aestivum]|uniref:Uncharacterized protein n=2 Tax=Triticum aestivum TaxID=4565 RepID=A0A9R1EYK0_WHEAT|nr:hypothetical protein CFC21_031916 [Triticum aestivum]